MNLKFIKIKDYVSIALVLCILYISFLIARPYLIALLSAGILVYIFNPLYKKLVSIVKNEDIAAGIMTLGILLVIIIPLIFLIQILYVEALNFYQSGGFTNIVSFITNLIGNSSILQSFDLNNILKEASQYLIQLVSEVIIKLPKKLLNLLISIFAIYFLFKDSDVLLEKTKKFISLKDKEKIFLQLQLTIHAIIYGTFLTAIIEGVFATIGFYIFGIPNALFWGLIVIILAIIPLIGGTAVYIPATIWLAYTNSIFIAIGLLIYSIIFISGTENLLKQLIIGKKANLHPLIILIGLFGGIKIFGLMGIIIGPLILSCLYVIAKIYIKELV
ncbi:MAG: AI-2E family transporter [Candidatus Nanoarchaeia archaeon]|nr:AI-2E family transporter [Candidatus Nanoarchaeia archaeon]